MVLRAISKAEGVSCAIADQATFGGLKMIQQFALFSQSGINHHDSLRLVHGYAANFLRSCYYYYPSWFGTYPE